MQVVNRKLRNALITCYEYQDVVSINEGWTIEKIPKWCQFAVGQLEKCPDTGRVHLQAYIEVSNDECKGGVRLRAIQQWLPGAHIEARKGSQQQAMDYCEKEETRLAGPWRYGEPKKHGRRADLAQICQDMQEGKSIYNIINDNPDNLRFINYMEKYLRHVPVQCRSDIKVFWFWGNTGIGKTAFAYKLAPNAFVYTMGQQEWWDGYSGEREIIIDECNNNFGYRRLLQLLDVYKYRGPVKGSFVPMRADTIYITSHEHPADIYKDDIGSYCPWEQSELGRRMYDYGRVYRFSSTKLADGRLRHTIDRTGLTILGFTGLRDDIRGYTRRNRRERNQDGGVITLFDDAF